MTVQYLIDSENVGDFWIPLLELPADKSELIVFYTRNSPHMSYESLIRLKESDRTVTFIKCYEGTNALDFQLVSELGYLIGKNESGSFVIVTNDTGFDAAVKYWRRNKKSVKRITGKECKNLERRLKEDLGLGRFSRQRTLSQESASYEPDLSEEAGNGEQLYENGSEPAEETEQRSSRPVLRDAESAALPDPEEDLSGETVGGLQDDESDKGLQDDESVFDSPSFDSPSFDSPSDSPSYDTPPYDSPSYEDADQEMYEDEALPFDSEDDGSDRADDEYAQPDEEEAADSEDKNGETDGQETEPETASASGDGRDESDGSDDFQPEHSSAREEEEQEKEEKEKLPEELLSAEQRGLESGDAGLNISGTGTEFPAEAEEDSHPAQEIGQPSEDELEGPSDNTSDLDGKMPVQEETEEASSGTGSGTESGTGSATEKEERDDQVLSSETGHRSKSRRSRTRRSRSGSRKQDQPAEEEQSGGSDEKQRSQSSDQEDTAASQSQPSGVKADQFPDDEEIARIVACIGADNLAELHNQLATFYGDQGKDIYLSIKSNSRSLPVLKPDLGQKFAYYCEIIFARSDYTGEYPADISEFLLNAREKLGNLNSLRYALIKHYGKEKGRRFYFLLKPFAKTMYQM